MLILVDDMGYSDLGCYGGEIETPHIDALAAERRSLQPVLQLLPLLSDAGEPAHRRDTLSASAWASLAARWT